MIERRAGSGPRNFREFEIIYHEVGDEEFKPNNAAGQELPQIDSFTTAYRPGSRAINYRSEPFFDRMGAMNTALGSFDESQGYGSDPLRGPPPPLPRPYPGEPT